MRQRRHARYPDGRRIDIEGRPYLPPGQQFADRPAFLPVVLLQAEHEAGVDIVARPHLLTRLHPPVKFARNPRHPRGVAAVEGREAPATDDLVRPVALWRGGQHRAQAPLAILHDQPAITGIGIEQQIFVPDRPAVRPLQPADRFPFHPAQRTARAERDGERRLHFTIAGDDPRRRIGRIDQRAAIFAGQRDAIAGRPQRDRPAARRAGQGPYAVILSHKRAGSSPAAGADAEVGARPGLHDGRHRATDHADPSGRRRSARRDCENPRSPLPIRRAR